LRPLRLKPRGPDGQRCLAGRVGERLTRLTVDEEIAGSNPAALATGVWGNWRTRLATNEEIAGSNPAMPSRLRGRRRTGQFPLFGPEGGAGPGTKSVAGFKLAPRAGGPHHEPQFGPGPDHPPPKPVTPTWRLAEYEIPQPAPTKTHTRS
jgi:hypothetical protein